MRFDGIILLGYPKSGKTTFAKKLSSRYSLSHLSLDAFIDVFETLFPEHGINHDIGTLVEITAAVRNSANLWIRRQVHYKIPFIFEGYHINPMDIRQDLSDLNLLFIALSYSKISAQLKLQNTRDFTCAPDWTKRFDDSYMEAWFKKAIENSETFEKKCLEADIPIFNTGEGFWEAYAKISTHINSYKNE
jgi:hypothetical protein